MRNYALMFAALIWAAGCGDGDTSSPDPSGPGPDTNNPCSSYKGEAQCLPLSSDGTCPSGMVQKKSDGLASYCLAAPTPSDDAGTEPECVRNCEDVQCGSPDGCGGHCSGYCAEGESCSPALYCHADDDPCASCREPKVCDANEGCVCPPPPEGFHDGVEVYCNPVGGICTLIEGDDCTWDCGDGPEDQDPFLTGIPTRMLSTLCNLQ